MLEERFLGDYPSMDCRDPYSLSLYDLYIFDARVTSQFARFVPCIINCWQSRIINYELILERSSMAFHGHLPWRLIALFCITEMLYFRNNITSTAYDMHSYLYIFQLNTKFHVIICSWDRSIYLFIINYFISLLLIVSSTWKHLVILVNSYRRL